jgi:hypothetical protein
MTVFTLTLVFVILVLIVTFLFAGPAWARSRTRSSNYPESYSEPIPNEVIEAAVFPDHELDMSEKYNMVISLMSERKEIFLETLQLLDEFAALDDEKSCSDNTLLENMDKFNLYIDEIKVILSRMAADPYDVRQDFSALRIEKYVYLLMSISDYNDLRKLHINIKLTKASIPEQDIRTALLKQSLDDIKRYFDSMKVIRYPSHAELHQEMQARLFDYFVSMMFIESSAEKESNALLNRLFDKSWSADEYASYYNRLTNGGSVNSLEFATAELISFFSKLQETCILVANRIVSETNHAIAIMADLLEPSPSINNDKTKQAEEGASGKNNRIPELTNSRPVRTNNSVNDEHVVFYYSANHRYLYYLLSLILFVYGCYLFFSNSYAEWAYIIVAFSIVPMGFGVEASGMRSAPLVAIGDGYIHVDEKSVSYDVIEDIDRLGTITMRDGSVVTIPVKKLKAKDRDRFVQIANERICKVNLGSI